MNQLWSIQTMAPCSVLKGSELSSHMGTWRNPKCMFPSESQAHCVTLCVTF